MGYEPYAALRLRRIAACTADMNLRETIEPLLMEAPNTFAEPMARRADESWPSATNVWDVPASGGRSQRAQYAHSTLDAVRMGDDLPALATALDGADFAELLLVMTQQATALTLIWEAHSRGAITLPESLERRVEAARRRMPRFLDGAPAR